MLLDVILLGLMVFMKIIGVSSLLRGAYFVVIIAIVTVRVVTKPAYMSPLSWFTSSWLLVGGAYFSELLVFSKELSNMGALFYLFLMCICVSCGFAMGKRGGLNCKNLKLRYGSHKLDHLRKMRRIITAAALLGIVGSGLFVIEMVVLNGASLSAQFDIRQIFQDKETSAFGQIAAVLLPGGFIALCGYMFYGRAVARWTRVCWALAALCCVVSDLFSGGRQVTFQLAMVVLIGLSIRRAVAGANDLKKGTMGSKLFMLSCVMIFLAYAGYVALGRNPFEQSRYPSELRVFQAEVNPDIEGLFDQLPENGKDVMVEGGLYLVNSIPNFQTDYRVKFPGMAYGLYLQPFLARRLASVIPWIRSPEERAQLFADEISADGGFAPGFQTAGIGLIGEFGKGGALLAAGILGALLGSCYRRFVDKPTFGRFIGVITACEVALYFPMAWAVADTTIFLLWVFSGALQLIESRWEREDAQGKILLARSMPELDANGSILA